MLKEEIEHGSIHVFYGIIDYEAPFFEVLGKVVTGEFEKIKNFALASTKKGKKVVKFGCFHFREEYFEKSENFKKEEIISVMGSRNFQPADMKDVLFFANKFPKSLKAGRHFELATTEKAYGYEWVGQVDGRGRKAYAGVRSTKWFKPTDVFLGVQNVTVKM